jgi:hypothetical protein
MSFSLYAATIPSYLQILGAVSNLIGKGEAFCAEKGLDANDIIQARLAPDMHPFAYQVKSVAVHSLGAIESVRNGQFSPDMNPPPQTFAALKARIAEAIAALAALGAAEVDAWVGRDMAFVFGERRVLYTVETFLLSFSQPNFYFHAATAYDILRHRGANIGKRDFLGQVRTKQ